MSLPDPNPEQAALVSVMTGALTGAFGLFLGQERVSEFKYFKLADFDCQETGENDMDLDFIMEAG